MADPNTDIFANFDPFAKPKQNDLSPLGPPPDKQNENIFANFDPFPTKPSSGGIGAFTRGAVGGVAPALGAIRGGALGLEMGAAIGGPIGGFGGMLAGAYLGSEGMSTAQNWLLDKVPKFRDLLGQGEEQKRLDQQEHMTASFMGGMFPYALTMSPMGALAKTLPENATTLQRLQNNPYTARLMSAGIVGGMQLGQEVATEDHINWNRVGIATAFGLAFNKNNMIGEAISEFGAKPIRRTFGLPEPANLRSPTAAEIKETITDLGKNEAWFKGEESQSMEAAHAALAEAGNEKQILFPDVEGVENHARKQNPELFDEYSALLTRQTLFRSWIDEANEPRPYQFADLAEKREGLEKELADHIAKRQGYTGGDVANNLRAHIRHLQGQETALNERAAAFKAGTAEETPDIAQARQHLAATEQELRDIQPQIRSALNDAAVYVGAQIVKPTVAPAVDTIGLQLQREFDTAVETHGRRSPEAGIAFDKLQEHRRAQPPPEVAAPPAEIPTAPPAGATVEGAPAGAVTPRPSPVVEAQKNFIAKDFSDRLIAAGEPPERAELIGKLAAIHYAARASDFQGARGSALDLYKAEGEKVVKAEAEGGPATPAPKDLSANPTKEEMSAFLAAGGDLTTGKVPAQAAKPEILGAMRLSHGVQSTLLRFPTANASTIIHELGHNWLEQLMRDAKHELAPEALRNDADTVVKWLGLKSADDLQAMTRKGELTQKARKAHEKFAEGFTRYLYEGKAPSVGLKEVFDRFQKWLTEIYDLVKGLNRPISPDIKSVFDRMLTEKPQETVIGPENQRGPTIQDHHEADLLTTEPRDADPAMARVEAEGKQYAEEQPPNIKDELKAEGAPIGEEARPGQGAELARPGAAGAVGPEQVVGRGGQPEPIPAGGGGGAEHGAINEGGANARPEGAPVPGGTAGERGGKAGGAEREHPAAPAPARDSIPPRETKAVDLAGNIRIENVTNIEEAAQAMRDSAERNNDYMAIRGQPITDTQLWEMASDFGMNPAEVNFDSLKNHLEKLFGGLKDAAPKMAAGRKMVQDTAKEVAALSRKAEESKTPEDVYAATQAITRLDMMMKALSGGTASWGRTGRALRDITGQEAKDAQAIQKLLIQNTGRTLFQMNDLIRKIAQYDRTDQVNKFVRDAAFHPWRMITEIWINGLISGLQTHLTYGVGNTITGLEKVGPDTAAAAAIGAIRKAMGREGDTVRIGEVAAGLRGMRRGIAPAALSAAQSAETGTTTLLHAGEQARFIQPLAPTDILSQSNVLNEAAKWSDVIEKLYGISSSVKKGIVAGAALQAAGGVEGAPFFSVLPGRGATPDVQIRGGTLPIGEFMRAPSRMIASIHSFFRPLNYTGHISQLAYRDAVNHPQEGVPFDTQVSNFETNPPQWAIDEGINVSNQLTLMGQGGEWTRKLSALINHEFWGRTDPETRKKIPGTGLQIAKFIDPFIHISTNIIDQAIVQHTPVGILSSTIRADLLGRNGTIRADLAAGRMLAGSAISLLFGFLAAEGYVTGSGPSNPDAAALWRTVYQPHSVRIGDTWYAMNRLGPMGMLLSTAADLYDVAHVAEEGDFAKAASALQHAIAQNILDESFMRGPSDLLKAINQPDRYGPSYVRNFVASFVPFSTAMRQMARAVDPYTRQARTMADAVRADIPGLSMDLLPRRDIWGEPLPSREGLGGDLTAIWMQRVNSDPTNQAMVDLGIHAGIPGRTIRNVKLSDEQYDDFSRIAGRLAKLRMDAIVRSPSFQSMPPGARQDFVNEQLRQSREVARGMMFFKYPQILVDAHTAKMTKRYGPQ